MSDLTPEMFRLPGTIVSTTYHGATTQHLVSIGPDHTLTVLEQNLPRMSTGDRWTPGSRVQLGWLPEHTGAARLAAAREQIALHLEACREIAYPHGEAVGLANLGQNAAAGVGQQGTALAQGAGQALTNAGTAAGAGIVGAGNAANTGLTNLWLSQLLKQGG